MKGKPAGLNDPEFETWREVNPETPRSQESTASRRGTDRDSRVSKNVRMRLRFSEMIRDEAMRRSLERGTRVTEADLLDEALSEWRTKHRIKTD